MPEQRFDQSQSLLQQQTIAPQMQQSLQLLQTPTLELQHLIQEELVANPTLEDESTDVSLEEVEGPSEDDDFDKEFEELSRLDEEWREYMAQSRVASPKRDDADEKHQFVMDSIVEPVTLQEHLMNQLHVADVSSEIEELSQTLIGNIDENGFLQIDIEDLSFDMGIPIDDLEEAKALVQSFDPMGVGAVDLRDCLLIQLERLGKHHSLEYRIVDHHLDDLAVHAAGHQSGSGTGVASMIEPRPLADIEREVGLPAHLLQSFQNPPFARQRTDHALGRERLKVG